MKSATWHKQHIMKDLRGRVEDDEVVYQKLFIQCRVLFLPWHAGTGVVFYTKANVYVRAVSEQTQTHAKVHCPLVSTENPNFGCIGSGQSSSVSQYCSVHSTLHVCLVVRMCLQAHDVLGFLCDIINR